MNKFLPKKLILYSGLIICIIPFFVKITYPADTVFILKENVGTSDNLTGMALLDIDKDGILDLITSGNSGTSIYRNDGTGHFQNNQSINSLDGDSIATGDINNDGYCDFIVNGNIYKNDGTGHFNLFQSTGGSSNLFLSDIDKDGYLDFISGGVVYKNDGTGHFTYKEIISTEVYKSVMGDIDNDGYDDFLFFTYPVTENTPDSTYPPTLRIYKNDHTEHFIYFDSCPANCLVSERIFNPDISLADMDNDGYSDILIRVSNFYTTHGPTEGHSDNKYYIFRNNRTGKFNLYNSWDAGSAVITKMVDINKDSYTDMIVGSSLGNIDIYLNDNKGNSIFYKEIPSNKPVLIATGDLDKDGNVDIVVGNYGYPCEIYLQKEYSFVSNYSNENIKITGYPNPFSNKITFIFDLGYLYCSASEFRVYDISGELIKKMSFNGFPTSVTWEANNIASGIYLCQIRAYTNSGIVVSKVYKIAKLK